MTKDEIIKALRDMAKYPTVTLPRDCEALRMAADLLAQPEQEPLDEWSEWRDMVVVNLMRHGNINKDFARRLAHFYQSKAPQRKPLTDEEIRRANHHMVEGAYDYSFKQGVKWAEYKHGIKGEA